MALSNNPTYNHIRTALLGMTFALGCETGSPQQATEAARGLGSLPGATDALSGTRDEIQGLDRSEATEVTVRMGNLPAFKDLKNLSHEEKVAALDLFYKALQNGDLDNTPVSEGAYNEWYLKFSNSTTQVLVHFFGLNDFANTDEEQEKNQNIFKRVFCIKRKMNEVSGKARQKSKKEPICPKIF